MSDFDEWMQEKIAARPEQQHNQISPLAKRIALENKLEWEKIVGTGENGLIIERDVMLALSKKL